MVGLVANWGKHPLLHHPQLLFQDDLEITHMYSAEGEEVRLSTSIFPTSNVEDWLREVEHSMKHSVRDIIERAIQAYPTVSHSFPAQACLGLGPQLLCRPCGFFQGLRWIPRFLFPTLSGEASHPIVLWLLLICSCSLHPCSWLHGWSSCRDDAFPPKAYNLHVAGPGCTPEWCDPNVL